MSATEQQSDPELQQQEHVSPNDGAEEDLSEETMLEGGTKVEGVVETKTMVDLPLTRVKRIMKSDVDVKLVSQEAVVLVTKAAELLLEHLAEEASKHTTAENRKTMMYKDLVQAVKECDVFDFLEDIVPERYSLQTLIENRSAKKP